ncbi:MAG TPA: hypothetical protein VLG27_02775 [Candidatus Saccharimonadia bacterium]|nr:hypothetical protein [Candidatus Saccharimonadia bacterium]
MAVSRDKLEDVTMPFAERDEDSRPIIRPGSVPSGLLDFIGGIKFPKEQHDWYALQTAFRGFREISRQARGTAEAADAGYRPVGMPEDWPGMVVLYQTRIQPQNR